MPAVFISYSRRDKVFVQRLHDALAAREYEVWVDWEDIPPSAEWFEEIRAGVRGADGFIYVISPDSVASEVCTKELDSALEQNKRVVPVICREPNGAAVPERAAALNWVFLRDGDDFETGVETLVTALETDLDHVRVHTRLGVQAERWRSGGQDRSQLLRGSDLTAAEAWLVAGAGKQPQATQLQRQYILTSRQAATRRQRTVIGGVSLALIVAVALAIVALVQRSQAVHERNVAVSQSLDASAVNQYSTDPELSLLLATHAVQADANPQSVDSLRAALAQSQVRYRFPLVEPSGGDVVWAPDGRRLLVTAPGSRGRAWARIYTPGSDTRYVAMPGPSVRDQSGWDAAGNRVVIGGSASTVYDAATGHAIFHVPGVALHAALTPDGTRVVTVDIHGTGHVYDVATGRQLATFRPRLHAGSTCFALSPNGRFAAQCDVSTLSTTARLVDSAIDVWSTDTGRLVRSVEAPNLVATVGFSPDSSEFVFAVPALVASTPKVSQAQSDAELGNPGTFVYRTQGSGGPVVTFPGGASAAAFSPNPGGSYPALVYAGNSGSNATAYVYEFYAKRSVPLQGATDTIDSVGFSPDGGYVVTASRDGNVRVYNATDGGAPLETLAGHQGEIVNASIGTNAYYVASSSDDGTARVWQGPTPVPALRRTDAPIGDAGTTGIGFDAAGDRIVQTGAGVGYNANGRILAASDLHTLATFSAPAGQVFLGQSIGRDGPILTLTKPGTKGHIAPRGAEVNTYDLKTGAHEATISAAPGHEITTAYASRSGAMAATLETGGLAELWASRTGRRLHALQGTTTAADAAAFSRDGSLLAVAHYPQLPAKVTYSSTFSPMVVQLWSTRTGRLLRTIQGDVITPQIPGQADYATLAVAFSPDGRLLAMAGADESIEIVDTDTGRRLHTLSLQGLAGGSYASSLAFSPDGEWLAAGSTSGAYLWRLPAFALQPTLQHVAPGAADLVTGGVRVAFTDNSQYLQTSGDEALGIWAVSDQQQLFHDYPLFAGSIDAAATRIVTGTVAGVSVYPCQLCGGKDQLMGLAGRRATRQLTAPERARYLGQS